VTSSDPLDTQGVGTPEVVSERPSTTRRDGSTPGRPDGGDTTASAAMRPRRPPVSPCRFDRDRRQMSPLATGRPIRTARYCFGLDSRGFHPLGLPSSYRRRRRLSHATSTAVAEAMYRLLPSRIRADSISISGEASRDGTRLAPRRSTWGRRLPAPWGTAIQTPAGAGCVAGEVCEVKRHRGRCHVP
jgi:hypothetical protein